MLRKIGWALALAAFFAISLACGRAKTPKNTEASPVALEGALGNKFVKAGASHQLVARIGITTVNRSHTTRPPVNLALLVDTSGSMEGKAIENARAASLALLESLAPEDRLAVVVFHSKAEVLLPSTRINDADMRELRTKIGAMKAEGTTEMSDGLRLALAQVQGHLEHDGVNRIVLLGDGVPNDDRIIPSLVAQAQENGISITTLGLGNDYDETLMGRIAQQSGGKFSLIEDPAKVAAFFKEEVVRLHKVVARNATLELRGGPGISVTNAIGRPAVHIPHGLSIALGDMSLGEQQEIVVELAGTPAKDGSTVEALDAVIRFQDGVGGTMREERLFLGAKSTTDEGRIASGKDENVSNAAARARDAAATLLRIEQDRKKTAPVPPRAGGLAAPSPADAAPAAAMPRMSADEQRRIHNDALQNFQSQRVY
jgi:Ca-activated chloride channel family protein